MTVGHGVTEFGSLFTPINVGGGISVLPGAPSYLTNPKVMPASLVVAGAIRPASLLASSDIVYLSYVKSCAVRLSSHLLKESVRPSSDLVRPRIDAGT